MGDTTGISWTDATWNPVRGCSRMSEGCRHCYAERVAARFSGAGQPYEGLATRRLKVISDDEQRVETRWTGEVRLIPEHLADPLRWKRPRRIFVNSMSDLFHEKLANEQIAAVFGVMAACQQHTFQVLTKRAKRMREWFAWLRGPSEETFTMQQRGIVAAPNTARTLLDAAYEYLGKGRKPELDAAWKQLEHDPWPLPNVWLGVSVENQAAADERIPELLATPAAVRWISAEPLLGEVDLDKPRCDDEHHGEAEWSDDATPWCNECDAELSYGHWLGNADSGIGWVVSGCESGPGARPCDVAWLRSLRDQCAVHGVPFWLKQAVEDKRQSALGPDGPPAISLGYESKRKAGGVIELPYLDGVQHAAFPDSSIGC